MLLPHNHYYGANHIPLMLNAAKIKPLINFAQSQQFSYVFRPEPGLLKLERAYILKTVSEFVGSFFQF